MKLLTAQQIRDWDKYTITREPVSSLLLMERAAEACVKYLGTKVHSAPVIIFCGPGNNGGDGLAVARMLAEIYTNIEVCLLHAGAISADAEKNLAGLEAQGKAKISVIAGESDFPGCTGKIIIDALYGTGLNKPLEGIAKALVKHINESGAYVISIDIPSGLKADIESTGDLDGTIIKADETLTFQVPKQSFMHPESGVYAGKLHISDIGLHPGFLNQVITNKHYITDEDVKLLLKPRGRFAHKGTFGHVLTAGGSFGKIGAAMLMSKAALRTGCGLVTAYIPRVGYTIFQTAIPEVMVMPDDELYELRSFPPAEPYDAVAAGPGMGTDAHTASGFIKWISGIQKPLVIDADGLNICSQVMRENPLFRLPEGAILTPHPKEFDRLAGPSANSFERLEKQIAFSAKHKVTVVLKGAHTSVSLPGGNVFFNSSGNPAMATGGSGDVLTGIIASLLAQGYDSGHAAVLGVYLHGLAGDLAAEGKGTIIASDIIEAIPSAIFRAGLSA